MSSSSALPVGLALLALRAAALAAEVALAASSSDSLKERGASRRAEDAFAWLKANREATFASLGALSLLCVSLAAAFGAVAGASLVARHLHLSQGLAATLGPLAGALATALAAALTDLPARSLAAARPAAVAALAARPAWLLVRLTHGPLQLFRAALQVLVRPFGIQASLGPPKPPLEDLERLLLEEAHRNGLDPQGPRLIRNIFEMSEKTARDVMVARTQLISLELSTPPQEILQLLAEHGHSRMPVFRGDVDVVVGILHTRDLVPMLQHPELIKLPDLLRPAHFIPWSKPVGEILREMRKKKIHMALVVDEYGGLLGLVTLEDVLEVIVGEIRDEHDEDVPEIEAVSDGSYLVRAAMPLEGFARFFDLELPPGGCETLGGFLNSLAGCIPEAGEKLFFGGLQLTVQDRTARKLRRIRVRRLGAAGADGRLKREASA